MENSSQLDYTILHETLRNRTAVGEAAPAGHPTAKGGQESVGSGSRGGFIGKLGISLAAYVSREGFPRARSQAHPWASSEAVNSHEESLGQASPEGSRGCRLQDRLMDVAAHSHPDPAAVWRALSPLPRVEAPGQPGMELSETGAPGIATGRRRDCPLEALPLAAYKKTRKNVGPIWSSSMNPAFCSFPMSGAPGRPKGRPPFSIISTSRTAFLPSVPLPSLPKEGVWPCTSGCAPATLPVWTSARFSKACSSISVAPWCSSGTEAPSTVEGKSSIFFRSIRGWMFTLSLPTHPNSIRQNTSGIKLITPSPTAHRRISRNSKGCCAIQSGAYDVPKNSFGPVSMLPICPGYDDHEYFHYLCKTQ